MRSITNAASTKDVYNEAKKKFQEIHFWKITLRQVRGEVN